MTLTALRDAFMTSEEFQSRSGSRIKPVQMHGGAFVSVDEQEPEFGHVIARHRTWEPHIVEVIKNNLLSGQTYVDVGANVGVMSFNAAKCVGDSGKIIAFEPNPINVMRFLEGMDANHSSNVVLFQFALSNWQSIVSLEGGSNTNISKSKSSRIVQSIRGDAILLDEPRIDFIKIDIEGFEPFAIAGMLETLKKHKPKMLCEFNPRCLADHADVNPEQFARDIFALTDEIVVIEHDDARTQINNASALMDLWRSKNDQAVRSGMLPDRMLHFDLLFDVHK